MAENTIAKSSFSLVESTDNTDSGFAASVEFTQEADLFAALAKAYFAMFGLTDEKIIRQFTLFANQYRTLNEFRTNELESETKNFRTQDDLIKAFRRTTDINGYLIKNWTIKIRVKNWFLETLRKFGIDFTLNNLTGKVNLKAVNPIPMIDKSDMRTGDVILVGGTHSQLLFHLLGNTLGKPRILISENVLTFFCLSFFSFSRRREPKCLTADGVGNVAVF